MKKVFLEKSNTKYSGYTIHRPFSKILKIEYLLINSLKFYTVCFQCIRVLKLSARPLVITSCKGFLKNKTGLELVSLPHFPCLIPNQISLSGCVYLLHEIL